MHLYTCTFYLVINISHLSVYAHSTCAKLKRGCCTSLTLKQVPRFSPFFFFFFFLLSLSLFSTKIQDFLGSHKLILCARAYKTFWSFLFHSNTVSGLQNVKLINKNTCFFDGSPLNCIMSFFFRLILNFLVFDRFSWRG